ncbi:MAG: PKD domain-containing protein, partial [Comamonadaceae bacterium]
MPIRIRFLAVLLSTLLLATCGGGGSASTPVTPVTPVNAAPVANAGVAQSVLAGALVTLDGSASSDANNDALTYAWSLTTKPAGSGAALLAATSVKPTFTADVAGSYVASLTVNDGKLSSSPATVSVTATVVNVAPVANA